MAAYCRHPRRTPRQRRAAAIMLAALLAACTTSGRHAPTGTPTTTSPTPVPTTSASDMPRLPAGVLASIGLPSGPNGLVAAGGFVWAQTHLSTILSRIDPRTNRINGRVDLGQSACTEPLAAFGDIWLPPCDTSTSVVVVDVATAKVRGTVPDAFADSMAAGFGSVWVASYDNASIRRIDPRTLKTIARIRVPSGAIAFGDGAIWSAGINVDHATNDGRLARIDPRTNRVTARYRISVDDDTYATFAYGSLWLMGAYSPMLTRIDPRTGKQTHIRLQGWQQLSEYHDYPIATGDNALWIRINDTTVARIDPATGRVTSRYPADGDGGGGDPVVAFGSLWVSNFGSDSLWRDRLPST